MEKLDKMGQKCQKGENRAQPRAPKPHPARANARFAPFFTCSRPRDVMMMSLMTSAFPLRVFTFFYSFFLSILTYKYPLPFTSKPPNTFFSLFSQIFRFFLVFLTFQFNSLSFRVLPFLGRTSYVYVIYQLFDSINGSANSAWRFSSNGNCVEVL